MNAICFGWGVINVQYIAEYNAASSPTFSVGEFWDGDTSKVFNWIQGTGMSSTAFNFPFRYALKSAVSSNSFGELKFAGILSDNCDYSSTFLV